MNDLKLTQYSTHLLAKEAQARGIKVTKIFPETDRSYLLLEKGGKTETIIGQRISKTTFNAHFICKNKEMTRRFLKRNNIKTTEGKLFYKKQIGNALNYIKTVPGPFVVKPVDATWGKHVYLGLKSEQEVKDAIEKTLLDHPKFLIEQEFQGNEYRITSGRKEVWGIINRIPANIVGNGKNSIKELIAIKNSDSRRGDSHEKSLVKIKIDNEVLSNLKENDLALESIPANGQQIFLRKTSNLSTGGDSIDITDDVHPKVRELAPKIISAVPGLPYAGFDFLTPDITRDPHEVGYAVIEINDSPMLSMHHFPFKGKERNVSKKVIDLIFPEN